MWVNGQGPDEGENGCWRDLYGGGGGYAGCERIVEERQCLGICIVSVTVWHEGRKTVCTELLFEVDLAVFAELIWEGYCGEVGWSCWLVS